MRDQFVPQLLINIPADIVLHFFHPGMWMLLNYPLYLISLSTFVSPCDGLHLYCGIQDTHAGALFPEATWRQSRKDRARAEEGMVD